MVADDLVQLNELGCVLLEPVREPLVKLGADRFRQRLVGGVANQEVAKAVGVFAGQQRLLRPDQILANERQQPAIHLPVLRRQGDDSAAVEDLTLDGAPLEHSSLCVVELVQPGRKQRLDRRRNGHFSRSVAHATRVEHRQHLPDEERIAAGRLEDAGAK